MVYIINYTLYIFGTHKSSKSMFKIDLKLTVCEYVHKAYVKVISLYLDDHNFQVLKDAHHKVVLLDGIYK